MSNVVLSLDPGKDYAIAKFEGDRLGDVAFRRSPWDECDVLVVEMPVIRPNGDASPNTIVRLAWAGGEIAGAIDYHAKSEVPTVAIPKSIVRKRVLEALDVYERQNLVAALEHVPEGKHHNCYDAVRHGLVYLGRMVA